MQLNHSSIKSIHHKMVSISTSQRPHSNINMIIFGEPFFMLNYSTRTQKKVSGLQNYLHIFFENAVKFESKANKLAISYLNNTALFCYHWSLIKTFEFKFKNSQQIMKFKVVLYKPLSVITHLKYNDFPTSIQRILFNFLINTFILFAC